MEGYLIRIPRDAWKGDKRSSSKGLSRRCLHTRLLYYTLGEGYLTGYLSPDDEEPVDTVQLTSFHVEVDPMHAMLMFEVFVTPKTRSLPSAVVTATQHHVADTDDSSDDEDDGGIEGMQRSRVDARQEASMLFFAANKQLVDIWSSRVLNWNRYVFDSFASADELSPAALEESKQALIHAFQQNCCASWFARPLSLKSEQAVSPSDASLSSGSKFMSNIQDANAGTNTVDASKPAEMPAPKPWWKLNPSNTRRVSSNSLRKRDKVKQ